MQNQYSPVGRVDVRDVTEAVKSGSIVVAIMTIVGPFLPDLATVGIDLLIGSVSLANPIVGAVLMVVLRLVMAVVEDEDGRIPGVDSGIEVVNGYLKYAGLTVKGLVQRVLNGLAGPRE